MLFRTAHGPEEGDPRDTGTRVQKRDWNCVGQVVGAQESFAGLTEGQGGMASVSWCELREAAVSPVGSGQGGWGGDPVSCHSHPGGG